MHAIIFIYSYMWIWHYVSQETIMSCMHAFDIFEHLYLVHVGQRDRQLILLSVFIVKWNALVAT